MFVLLLNASIDLQVSACCCAVLCSCLSRGLHISAHIRLYPCCPFSVYTWKEKVCPGLT